MDLLKEFIFLNFSTIIITFILVIHASVTFKSHPKISIYSILIILCALLLVVSNTLERYAKLMVNPSMTLVFAILGYTLRPTCIYLFILLTVDIKKNPLLIGLTCIPLVVTFIIYSLSFVPDLGPYIVHFGVNESGKVYFQGGVLRYTAHVVALGYLLWFMYISFTMLTFKKLTRGIITLSCSVAVIIATIIESFFNPDGNISVLNTAISLSAIVYYLYLISEKTDLDEVSGLYNKDRYLQDVEIRQYTIRGLAIISLNLLDDSDTKNIEYNNRIIRESASILLRCINRRMVVYRFSENEFLLLAKDDEEKVNEIINKYDLKMKEKNYLYSVGIAFKKDEKDPIYRLINEAENTVRLKTHNPRFIN